MTDQEKKIWNSKILGARYFEGNYKGAPNLIEVPSGLLLVVDSEFTALRSENEGLRKTNNHLHAELKRVKEAVGWVCEGHYHNYSMVDFATELRRRAGIRSRK